MLYLSLGTNLGDLEKNIKTAIEEIEKQIGEVVSQSALIHTEPWGFESKNPFLNACVGVEFSLSAVEVLNLTPSIERKIGRLIKSEKIISSDGAEKVVYHDRVIDIDILMYDNMVVNTSRLVIPHPLMSKRWFVLKPLSEIAQDVNIPGTSMSVGEMLRALEAAL